MANEPQAVLLELKDFLTEFLAVFELQQQSLNYVMGVFQVEGDAEMLISHVDQYPNSFILSELIWTKCYLLWLIFSNLGP